MSREPDTVSAALSRRELSTRLATASAVLRTVLESATSALPAGGNPNPPVLGKSVSRVSEFHARDLKRAFEAISSVAVTIPPELEILPEIAAALAAYRGLLHELKSRLPQIHERLLVERARLEARQSHSFAVLSWISANHRTR